jgi:hypothetical protein
MQAGLAVKATTHEAWEAIQKVHLGADRVREANAEWLRREFSDLAFRPGETMEDFSLWLTTVASQLRVLGDEVSDKEVVKKLLHVVPNNLEQVVISMETLLDLKSLSIEEVDGHLLAVEQRKKPSPSKEAGGRLLLTEEEWMARMKTCDGSGSNAGSRSGGGKNRGNKQGAGEGKKSSTGCNDVCGCCSKKGHWARECCKKKRDAEAQAHVAHGEEEEQSLLMAHAFVPINESTLQALPPWRVEIVEQKVFANLGPLEEHDDKRWVLDTGATNHMTDARHFFTELDTHIFGQVKFGDGSITKIEGRGNIILVCKSGEHRTLTGVYYILQLKTIILSISQLDENDCRITIHHGMLQIFDQADHLLAKVSRSVLRLYYLELHIGQSIYLVARTSEEAWLWHARFRHLNFGSLRKLAAQNMVRGLPLLDQVDQVCDGCLVGKQRRASFPAQVQQRASSILDLIHGDLCGPVSPATPSGKRYFLLLVDDMSRYMWLRLLSSKDEVPSAIKKFQAIVEVETGKKLKVLHIDRGGEFTSVKFDEHYVEHGVER